MPKISLQDCLDWIQEVKDWVAHPLPSRSLHDRVDAHFCFYDLPREVLREVAQLHGSKVYGEAEPGKPQVVKLTTSIILPPPVDWGTISVQFVQDSEGVDTRPLKDIFPQ